jgi:hypothetical protein
MRGWHSWTLAAAIVLFHVFASACSHEPPRPEWSDGSPYESPSADVYFESGELDEDEGLDKILREWWSRILSAAGEPALRDLSAREAYRFLHVPSFRHPAVIRVEEGPAGQWIVFKKLTGSGGYDPGKMETHRHRKLTSDEWQHLQRLIFEENFWGRPTHGLSLMVDDGTLWVLEGKSPDAHRTVYWELSDCYACRYLVDLADAELDDVMPLPHEDPTFPPTSTVPPPPDGS